MSATHTIRCKIAQTKLGNSRKPPKIRGSSVRLQLCSPADCLEGGVVSWWLRLSSFFSLSLFLSLSLHKRRGEKEEREGKFLAPAAFFWDFITYVFVESTQVAAASFSFGESCTKKVRFADASMG